MRTLVLIRCSLNCSRREFAYTVCTDSGMSKGLKGTPGLYSVDCSSLIQHAVQGGGLHWGAA